MGTGLLVPPLCPFPILDTLCLRWVQDSAIPSLSRERYRKLDPTRVQQAVGTGFEPVQGFLPLVFKTSAFVHSANPPWRRRQDCSLTLRHLLSSSSKLTSNFCGGDRIRTCACFRTHAFQACALNHSATPPCCLQPKLLWPFLFLL